MISLRFSAVGWSALTVTAITFSCASSWAVKLDTVAIGNVGNSPDSATGYGGVSYAYRIGKFEVTVGQYTEFLNAVAQTDTYSLYNPSMATNLRIAGIARNGAAGSYSYSVIGSANKPITYVSWGDAARFSNWLDNGQPVGAQGPSTTETGAYTLNGATSNSALIAVSRSAEARWFITSENEWYKAAYHQPAALGGDSDDYWDYPTRTNSEPYSDQPPGIGAPTPSNTANFYATDGLANGYNDGHAVTGTTSSNSSQNYLSNVGAYTFAASPYGTFDQGGNVYEWNEAVIDGAYRGVRGGSYANLAEKLLSSERFNSRTSPAEESSSVGFRVAFVPEPGAAVLGLFASALFCSCCRRNARRPQTLGVSAPPSFQSRR
ncbi:formylglycine-generating enzyme family protein [Lacipirellula sp.]|uniref:formylglycine-generating enzyme family protein n=1 Tax=Lacipirellula sp. TaxID=2691419 RepID=UPI003D123788